MTPHEWKVALWIWGVCAMVFGGLVWTIIYAGRGDDE